MRADIDVGVGTTSTVTDRATRTADWVADLYWSIDPAAPGARPCERRPPDGLVPGDRAPCDVALGDDPTRGAVRRESVAFAAARDVTLRGHLYLPGDPGPRPALVLSGPYTGVKEQVVGTYARALAERGFVALAFDHRNFGESDGAVRCHEDPRGKVEDLVAATSFLVDRAEVDAERLGAVGICLGASYAFAHAALDPRIGALVGVGALWLGPRGDGAGRTEEGAVDAPAEADAPRRRAPATARIPVVGEGADVALPGAESLAYWGTERAASPHWRNEVTALSAANLAEFDALDGIELLAGTPSLLIHGTNDALSPPERAIEVHDRLAGERALQWIDLERHTDLYDGAAAITEAVERTWAWMGDHLGRDRVDRPCAAPPVEDRIG